ncbi:MAG TPA: multidrug ABC transporter substrate-binding protein [Acidobacteria bacterium]|nr:multidrug ABC transporter substrate-binding protein [Acidobacteriota bacterium]
MSLLSDIRFGVKMVAKRPGLSAIAIFALALGVGLTTTMFSIIYGLVLKGLPFPDSEELVQVFRSRPAQNVQFMGTTIHDFTDWRDQQTSFEDVAAYFNETVNVAGSEGRPIRYLGAYTSAHLFDVLQVQPILGRTFRPEEDHPSTEPVMILSYRAWQDRFQGDPEIVGKVLRANAELTTVVGVMPERFGFPSQMDAWLPLRIDPLAFARGSGPALEQTQLQAIGRLRDGVAFEGAQAEMSAIAGRLATEYPESNDGIGVNLMRQVDTMVGPEGRALLYVMLGAVFGVLLIACANVANLFVVRAEGRDREVAVRTAIGAARRQIAGQYLVESVLLGLLGGAVGVGLAQAGLRLLVAMAPVELPRLDAVSIDPGALTFTLAISLFSGVIFGLLPVVRCGRLDLVGALKEGGRGGGAGRERHLARNALVVGQVALALVLVVGAGLMVRTFQAIQRSNPGFQDAAEVLILNVTVSGVGMEDPGAAVRRHELIARRLAETTGVTSVGLSSSVTMDRSGGYDPVFVEDFPLLEGQIAPIRRFKWIGAGYFETMRNPIVAGRTLTWADIHNRARVLLVTENFAREYWGDPADAVGNRIGTGQQAGDWREIIGVVGDVRDDGVTQPPVAVVYWPMLLENYWADVRGDEPFVTRSMRYAIRSPRVGTPDFLGDLKQVIRSVQPGAPLTSARTLRDLLRESTARTSFTLVILAIAAVVALLLAAVGMYGVISYVVMQRTQEIGVRIALGAEATTVTRMVLRQGLVLAVTGVALGLVGAYWLTRLITGLLVGVSAVDPATYVTVSTTLTAIALLASYLPARRAAHVDPIQALRAE